MPRGEWCSWSISWVLSHRDVDFLLRMLDMDASNNTLSAYVITIALACTVTLLMETDGRLQGIPSSLSFFMVAVRRCGPSYFEMAQVADHYWVGLCISLSIACVHILVLNLLIGQGCSGQRIRRTPSYVFNVQV